MEAILEIEAYIFETSYDNFKTNSMIKFACIKQLEIIGEASNFLSKNTKDNHPEIEWSKIIGLRHILVHDYYIVDEYVLWNIIQYDLPFLKSSLV